MSDEAPRELTANENDHLTMYALAQDVVGLQKYVASLFVADWIARHEGEANAQVSAKR